MHRLASIPINDLINGQGNQSDNIVFVEQQPAPIVIITAADTDIQTFATVSDRLTSQVEGKSKSQIVECLPEIRVVNLLQLQQQIVIDTYAEEVLSKAKVIILRLIGGQSYWSYGLEVVKAVAAETGARLFVLPGDERPDPTLTSHSTVSMRSLNQVWQYFIEAGVANYENLLKFISTEFLDFRLQYQLPRSVPRVGRFGEYGRNYNGRDVGIIFYRSHYLAGNTKAIACLCEALSARNLNPFPIYISSLKEPDVQAELMDYYQGIDLILNTTSFSLASLETDSPKVDLWQNLNVPVFQVIFSGSGRETWESSNQGLTPRDIAMNVALPEVDGRIITRAVSFKAGQSQNSALQTEIVVYEPELTRIDFVADLSQKWIDLKSTPIPERKIALILANYPNRDGRLANGVGLDTPASCVEILKALKDRGYTTGKIPETSADLIKLLTTGVTNDPEPYTSRTINQLLSVLDYQTHFQTLPAPVKSGIQARWGEEIEQEFTISGVQFGNIFVGIQPPRGYDRDPTLNYHAPDLEPTHDYVAFYYWIRKNFQAIAHVGKHGNLEWLPGKSIALSENCYPEAVFGAMPHLYPFIVNDPGEGSQAKRRSQAVIIDHLTPPMTRAELYGGLQKLECLIDEYYEAETLDPSRLGTIKERLLEVIKQEHLHQELGISSDRIEDSLNSILTTADGYLCELKEAQIRDGLHIFGQCPQGSQLRDLIIAIARNPTPNRMGLTRAIADDWNLDFDPLTANLGEMLDVSQKYPKLQNCRIIGDVVEAIEDYASELVDKILSAALLIDEIENKIKQELNWISDRLLPSLQNTTQEITNFLRGLNGEYIASGASGAPTRGRPEVLPTGRNFYSVDIRAIPTETAWDIGRKAADRVIEAYTQEHGEYPKTIGLSIWGTSTMRTGGDDLAEALALIGVQPVWDGVSRRVVDFEILPLSLLDRPRVDVTLRISGFFRDAFPNLIELFDRAVNAVASLDESAQDNPLAAKVQQEIIEWQREGLTIEDSRERSLYRIFGSKPSAYGAGLQGLIESQNWETEADLARAYINWSAYAYTRQSAGKSAPEAFKQRLENTQIVLQNQDNREHDLLDSDDYYQFQGGMTSAIKSLTGTNPDIYFGDNSQSEQPKVRKLSAEIARVYRSRVVNPKWIAGVMRHGYKGAFEMAATVDFLFAYDATTNCVEDFMYAGIADNYLFNPEVQTFMQKSNPWALRDIGERLLEANQRGLWQDASSQIIEKLKGLVNETEGIIESQT